ncbi:MAG: hypothetical protein EOP86_11720 [Verrucomicrobiaceae bacterium]|nr:MAG: hypothetical protein EOP86_11720 [Verrucomicrobiaceae bacterium]
MRPAVHHLLLCAALLPILPSPAMVPEHTVQNGVVSLKGVGPDNPVLHDNDFRTDVPDAARLWMKASPGEAKLVGNVITRRTFGWEEPVIGSTVAIRRPPGDKESDTAFERTEGSALIIAEEKKPMPEKPLPVLSPSTVKPVASTATGLLLEPPVDLSKFTREEFLRVSASVGPHKINKPWTTAIPALPPHPRADVHGLDEREIRACMLQARDLFEKGAAVPVSDVGLISTQEDVIRRPMFNHVSAFSNEVAYVYLLVQKPAGADAWGTFSIVQDRTTNPPLNYFAEIRGDEVRFEAVSCYKCHANGPLAIHPARGDLINDAALLKAFNQHIEDQPLSRMHYPPHDPAPAYGDPLTLKACTKCHANDADRAPLFKVHSHSIRVLVDYGHMPPARALRPDELAELKAWLAVKP